MRRNAGPVHTNLRYSRRYATSDDRWSVFADICFPSNEPVRRMSMLEDERMSSESGGGKFWIFRTGSSSVASLSWWVIPTARERPSVDASRGGEVKHMVGMRARKWCDRERPRSSAQVARAPSFSPSTTISDSLSTAPVRYRRLSLNGNRKSQANSLKLSDVSHPLIDRRRTSTRRSRTSTSASKPSARFWRPPSSSVRPPQIPMSLGATKRRSERPSDSSLISRTPSVNSRTRR